MKIAYLVIKNIATGGGIEKYTLEVGSRLVQRGHQVRVYTMKNYGAIASPYPGIEVVGVPCLPLSFCEKISACQVAGAMAAMSDWADIMHYHSVSPGSTMWMANVAKKKTVIQMHGLEWKRGRWGRFGSFVHKVLEKLSILSAQNVTAVSKVQCDYFSKKYKTEVEYIPTGVEPKEKLAACKILDLGLEPQKYILFASRLVSEKGAHYLIEAFRKIKTDCKLVIAGDAHGEKKYKKKLAMLAHGDERIIFTGFVQGKLLEELFSNALVYVQPSEIEGLSIALLEAMSYGICCLASDIPENIEALGECGLYFLNKDVESLSEQLELVTNNDFACAKYSKQAKHRVVTEYSWNNVVDSLEKLYTRIV